MSSIFPNGTIHSMSLGFDPAIEMTALSNGNPAVATIAGGTLANGDILIAQSDWALANDRIVRAASVTGDTVSLGGLDTSDTGRFPAGSGKGTLLRVNGWTQFSQTTEVNKSGGEQQFFNWQYLEDRNATQRQRPTSKSAKSLVMTFDYDPKLTWHKELIKASELSEPVVLRAKLSNGSELYYYVFPSFDSDPNMTINENMRVKATFSFIGDMTRFDD